MPGGYIDSAGRLHRQVELNPLVGRDEELLSRHDQLSAELVTELLVRCVRRVGELAPVTTDIARQLLVGDRQYLLLKLRQLTFGDRIQSVLSCPWPNCGRAIDIDFNISDIPISECQQVLPVYESSLSIDGLSLPDCLSQSLVSDELKYSFRLPNGADQETCGRLALSSPAHALHNLLGCCVKKIGAIENPGDEIIAELPAGLIMNIEQDMEQRAPSLELTMEVDCPECKRSFIAPFELQDFFFGELIINTELLYREVHYLAFHYHWSEEEVMAMPRSKRRQYIDVLSQEIEVLNDQAG